MSSLLIPDNHHHQQRPSGKFMTLMRFFPSYAIALGVYCLWAVTFSFEGTVLGQEITLPSEAKFSLKYNELFVLMMVGMLLIEIIKASSTSHESTWMEHMFSTVVFVACIVLFISWKPAGNGTFLILTAMTCVDVLAGWTISYRSALRDVSFG